MFLLRLQRRSSCIRSNMNPTFWLMVTFLMSRIGLFQADVVCPTSEKSIGGMFLRGHTFKSVKVGWPGGCYLMCQEEVTCQSYNFVIGHKVCELNNRTKEARPEDFMPDQIRFYMKRARTRGTLQFFFIVCSSFTMQPIWMPACVAGGVLPANPLFRREHSNGNWKAPRTTERGGHWDFRFCGFGYFFDRFFGFCVKRRRFFGFGVQCGLRIFQFLASGFRFS